MGKARIIEHLGSSKYKVTYYYDLTIIEAKLIGIDAQITTTNVDITAVEAEIVTSEATVDTSTEQLDTAIEDYQTCVDTHGEAGCTEGKTALKAITVQHLLYKEALANLYLKLDNLNITLERLNKAKTRLENIDETETMEIWCSDLCDRPTGEADYGTWLNHGEVIPNGTYVGTIDIFDYVTRSYRIFIAPSSYTADSDYDIDVHGFMAPTLSNDGNAFVYNYNMRGPKEVWDPVFRLAIINSIDDGIAEITYNNITDLDGVHYNTDDHNHDSDVECDYMVCDTNPPFRDGDQVIVTFSGDQMADPIIIGYTANPKPCVPAVDLYYNPTYGAGDEGWGEPFWTTDPTPVEINEPFGTNFAQYSTEGQDGRHKIAELSSSVTTEFGNQGSEFPGNKCWLGERGSVSWWGQPSSMAIEDTNRTIDCTRANVGDCYSIDLGNYGTKYHTFGMMVHNKNGTGYDAGKDDDGVTNFEAYFDINYVWGANFVFINGTKLYLQDFTIGVAGTMIGGAAIANNVVTGNWLFYTTETLDNKSTAGAMSIHAVNIETDQHIVLETFRELQQTGYYKWNKGDVIFSQDGMNFITLRYDDRNDTGPTTSGQRLLCLRGEFTFTELGAPSFEMTEETIQLERTTDTRLPYMLGYSNNVEVFEYFTYGTTEQALFLVYFNAEFNVAIAKQEQDDSPYQDKLYVEVGGNLFSYSYNSTTSVWDIVTSASIGSTMNSVTCERLVYWPTWGSYLATKDGVFICMSAVDQQTNDPVYDTPLDNHHNHNNVFIANDGTVTQLGPMLLDSTMTDPLFSASPMVIVKKNST